MKLTALIVLIMGIAVFAADEKGEYIRERYFPTSWEPPTVTNNGGVISISPSVPNFDRPTKTGSYIEVGNTTVERDNRVKKVVFTMTVNGKTKRIYVGKTFRINNHPFKFIGAEADKYIIQDLKSKKKIVFTKNPPKKKKAEK